ncbi:MotA/TolQ/ExbB proton channel family protein [Spectribacter hydrogenoxidans]|uniref:MotA/TolQ/ExbB proton channel family protein n=1 Tax=Spectribacter hydrogenoxidans TaxID=3075608 RepID=A0ABU3C0Y2_9GAMM|nr:MotA/TolQ/ExbB proton channel family protein [Salinisphaera sp. W335]MDT0635218.1 MotA/TolQ/ExbB proton channel family protein [Salinisphaera sp. W335]
MRGRLSVEFVYQLFALLLAVIIVHAAYVGMVRPQARAAEAERAAVVADNPDAAPDRSLWVIVRDYEQEVCFILMLWALALLAYKAVAVQRERRLLQRGLIAVGPGESILPEDAREHTRAIEALPAMEREFLYPRALLTALHRFRATRNVQDVSDAIGQVCEAETDRLDSELSMVRYIAWAIPSIGFIGTVRGIGEALGLAHKAVEGDISGVTAALGLAFNSTFVALVLSIILMFFLHQLQLVQERLVLDTQTACDRGLIQNLQAG